MRNPAETLLLLSLGWCGPVMAQGNPFGGFEVRTLKREAKHLETAALICALQLEGEGVDVIAKAWMMHFPKGPTRDDKLLVNSTTSQLCPSAKTP